MNTVGYEKNHRGLEYRYSVSKSLSDEYHHDTQLDEIVEWLSNNTSDGWRAEIWYLTNSKFFFVHQEDADGFETWFNLRW